MALHSTTNLKAFDAINSVKKNIKLGDKIYTSDEQAFTVQSILDKNKIYARQRTIDVAGKNVHEFTVRIRPAEMPLPTLRIDHILMPHYEVEMAS